MRKLFKLITTSILSVCSINIGASEADSERVQAGTRGFCLAEYAKHIEQNDLSNQHTKKISLLDLFKGAIHFLAENLPADQAIKLQDGSMWTVAAADYEMAGNWSSEEILFIFQNQHANSLYQFSIYNHDRDEMISANLHSYLDPKFHTSLNHRIVEIDSYNRVILQSGDSHTTMWAIRPIDNTTDWRAGDTVIIGVENKEGLWEETYPHVLINATCLQTVRVYWMLP